MSRHSSSHRTRRSAQPHRSRIFRRVLWVSAASAAIATASLLLVIPPTQEAAVASIATTGEPDAGGGPVETVRDGSPVRKIYPYSVIPGGVHSAAEFAEAIAHDPIVAAHYPDASTTAMHLETVDSPRQAYMSYRIGDRVYWTRRKLPLRAGERILTDGRVVVRGRCGNRVSDTPMSPTSEEEPAAAAFELEAAPLAITVGAPEVHGAPMLPLGAFPPRPTGGAIDGGMRWFNSGGLPNGGVDAAVGAIAPGRVGSDGLSSLVAGLGQGGYPPRTGPAPLPPSNGPGGWNGSPGDANNDPDGTGNSSAPSPSDTPGIDPPGSDSGGSPGDGSSATQPPGDGRTSPQGSVPEPATVALLATGIALLGRRRRRMTATRPSGTAKSTRPRTL